jgi:hypothetical protein
MVLLLSDQVLTSKKRYQRLVDMLHSIGVVSHNQFMHNPSNRHMNTMNLGLLEIL